MSSVLMIDCSATEIAALEDLNKAVNTSTPEESGKVRGDYKTKYNKYEIWIDLLILTWITHVEKWWKGNFQASLDPKTLIRLLK